jgi:YfiR/HmsC-like
VVDNKSKEMKTIVEATKAKSTLIVGQREGLVKRGASIDFVTLDDDKLGFEVSRTNIENQKLKISGELLRLAILTD